MRERPGIFILEVLALSLLLYILWYWKGQSHYLFILTCFLKYLFLNLGITANKLWCPTEYFINLIPFASLMLLTKGMYLWDRVRKLIIGLMLLVGSHVLLTTTLYLLHPDYQSPPTASYYRILIPLGLFSEVLPFLLWAIFAREQLSTFFLNRKVSAAGQV